jgi:hypothetical protein
LKQVVQHLHAESLQVSGDGLICLIHQCIQIIKPMNEPAGQRAGCFQMAA